MEKRHAFFYRLVMPLLAAFLYIWFGYTYKVARGLPENYIVLSNHNTDYDPLLVGVSFPHKMMYFVGSEHIARWKNAYKFLRFAFDPIMRYKGMLAHTAVLEVLRRVRAGHSICMFPEGARSWDGVTAPILPSTGKLIKSARCGLVTYRIEGGYFVSPRWSRALRRGRLHGAPVRVYTAAELAAMPVEEINACIARDLYEDAYARQQKDPSPYKCRGLAEGMENLLFLCPKCGAADSIHSRGSSIRCSACGAKAEYTAYGMLTGELFQTVKQLADWQKQAVVAAAARGEVYSAPAATLVKVAGHKETPVAEGPLSLGPAGLACGDAAFPLEEVQDLTMHGRHTIVFSTPGGYYELRPAQGANALKFHLLYQAYKGSLPI